MVVVQVAAPSVLGRAGLSSLWGIGLPGSVYSADVAPFDLSVVEGCVSLLGRIRPCRHGCPSSH